mgnify:CR=1 FL=1
MYGKIKEYLQRELADIKAAGLYKTERVIASPQRAEIEVAGRSVLNFCANNYLGLSDDERLIEAAKRAMDERGFGMSSVRFICGCQDIHKELERAIADYFGTEDTILYAACFDANGGVFEPLFTEQDAIISDALNHASIIDGVRLSKAVRYRYANADMEALEDCLKRAQAQRFRVICTDGVFSMPPAVVGAGIELFKILGQSNELHDRLVANVEHFRAGMMAAGFDIKPTQSAICAVMLYDAKLSQDFAARLQEEGVFVTGFYYPVVPKGQARIRVQVSAGHTVEQLDRCIAAFVKVGRELNVLQ